MNRSAFDSLRRTVENHFLIDFYAAVFVLAGYLQRLGEDGGRQLEEVLEHYPFLGGYLSSLQAFLPQDLTWGQGMAWIEAQVSRWEHCRRGHLPLGALGVEAGIGFTDRMALMCVGLVEDDFRFGELFADLQAPSAGQRPTAELVGRIMLFIDPERARSPGDAVARLLELGLVNTGSPGLPRSQWPLQVTAPLWKTVRQGARADLAEWCRFQPSAQAVPVRDLVFPAGFHAQLRRLPAVLRSQSARVLVLRGREGSDRRRIAGALARSLRRHCILLEHQALHGGMPAFLRALDAD
jgi:hypothetical protein